MLGMDFALMEMESGTLRKIDEALLRLERGQLRRTAASATRRISEARLKALPFASLCRDCQEQAEESEAARNARPSRFFEDGAARLAARAPRSARSAAIVGRAAAREAPVAVVHARARGRRRRARCARASRPRPRALGPDPVRARRRGRRASAVAAPFSFRLLTRAPRPPPSSRDTKKRSFDRLMRRGRASSEPWSACGAAHGEPDARAQSRARRPSSPRP